MFAVKHSRTSSRTSIGSSCLEQQEPELNLETWMECLTLRPVARERRVTLFDFDDLMYRDHSLLQLFKYQGFLHQLSWTDGFCVDGLVRDFYCADIAERKGDELQLTKRVV